MEGAVKHGSGKASGMGYEPARKISAAARILYRFVRHQSAPRHGKNERLRADGQHCPWRGTSAARCLVWIAGGARNSRGTDKFPQLEPRDEIMEARNLFPQTTSMIYGNPGSRLHEGKQSERRRRQFRAAG